MAFSPDGTTLASGGGRDVNDAFVGGGHRAGETHPHRTYVGLSCRWRSRRMGSTLASAGGRDETVRVWDVATGQEKNTLTGHTASVVSVAFSPDGSTLASAGGRNDNTVKMWDPATGHEKKTLTGHNAGLQGVEFSPDGATLASADSRGTVRLWDAATGREKKNPHGTWREFLFAGVFTGWDNAGNQQSAQGGVAVGRCHRAEYTRTQGTYRSDLVGGVFAGWDDAGKRQLRLYDSAVGRLVT